MFRYAILLIIGSLFAMKSEGQNNYAVVADSNSHKPLPSASIFGRDGKLIGICNGKGRLPYVSSKDFPITVRYMGFYEKTVPVESADTIFLREKAMELPEVVVTSKQQKLLHMLAYVREYSTLTTYTDTVFLFREKMVDFMLPTNKKMKYRGWRNPRILTSRSYYQFTNANGLDSVSDQCNNHFSWSDWVGIAPNAKMPYTLRRLEVGTDTVFGKYSPAETWIKNGERINLGINVLADTTSRKWVPNLSNFFGNDIDYEQFRITFNYDNVFGDSVSPIDLTGYSYNIESNGRGRSMFMFNKRDEPFFVSTYAEVYIMDKAFITVKEAKKWENNKVDADDLEIFMPADAPELTPAIQLLVDRVTNVDHEAVRLSILPDERLVSRHIKRNLGQALLSRLSNMFGISSIIGDKKRKKSWNNFRREQKQRNNSKPFEND